MLLLPVQFRQNQRSLQRLCQSHGGRLENSRALWQMPGYCFQWRLQTAEMICVTTASAHSDFVLCALWAVAMDTALWEERL